jgi:hypothetical protein
MRKARQGDHPAFVDGFSYGQILVLSPGCNQHMTFGTTRFCDGVVVGIWLVNERERLIEEHAYLLFEGARTKSRLG